MAKRVLFVATVGAFFGVERNDIKILQEMGYEVHCAANFSLSGLGDFYAEGIVRHQIDFARIPWSKTNITAYRELKSLMEETRFDLVHCHTPMGGVLGRMAARKYRKSGTKVIYTAHGFHFCRTSPKKNWLLFYPIECFLAYWTDVLITINEDDYALAKRHMHARKVRYVPGVGIDMDKFAPAQMKGENKNSKREELGLQEGQKLLLSVGELNRDKNHMLVLKALAKETRIDYKYCICGNGPWKELYEQFITEHHLEDQVTLLGFRTDISEILQVTDLFVFPSTFEGLPVALMEAIASKVMVICSASRGNTDLVKDKRCLFDYRSVDELIKAIGQVESLSKEEAEKIIEENYSRLIPRERSRVGARMKKIYEDIGGKDK